MCCRRSMKKNIGQRDNLFGFRFSKFYFIGNFLLCGHYKRGNCEKCHFHGSLFYNERSDPYEKPQRAEEPGGYGQEKSGGGFFQLQPYGKVIVMRTNAPDGIEQSVVIYMHHADEGTVVEQQVKGNEGGAYFILHEPGHPWETEIIDKGNLPAKKVCQFLTASFFQFCFVGKYEVYIDGAKEKTPEKQKCHFLSSLP